MVGSTFNIEEMDIKLDTEYVGTNFIFYNEAGSTNEQLLTDESITQHGTVLIAENQFSGRGRMGRVRCFLPGPEEMLPQDYPPCR